jgi:transposase-like protein
MPNPETDYRLASRERQAEMNVLPMEKQVQIVSALVEGNSIRSTARMVGVEHKTVMRVLLRVGAKCQRLLNEKMRGLQCRNVEVDEIWSYVGKKEGRINGTDNPLLVGDQYVFVAMDSETKLIPSYRIGKRNAENAWYFMRDLSERVTTRMQITSDGFRPYYNAARMRSAQMWIMRCSLRFTATPKRGTRGTAPEKSSTRGLYQLAEILSRGSSPRHTLNGRT